MFSLGFWSKSKLNIVIVGVSESEVNPLNRQLFKRGHVDKAVDGMGLLSDPGSLGSMKAIIYCQPQT